MLKCMASLGTHPFSSFAGTERRQCDQPEEVGTLRARRWRKGVKVRFVSRKDRAVNPNHRARIRGAGLRCPMRLGGKCLKLLAGEPGFEPGLTESESVGLPLTYSPTAPDVGASQWSEAYNNSQRGAQPAPCSNTPSVSASAGWVAIPGDTRSAWCQSGAIYRPR